MAVYFPDSQTCPECQGEMDFVSEWAGPVSWEYGGTSASATYRCKTDNCREKAGKGYYSQHFRDDPQGDTSYSELTPGK